jgi:hypothetical protein
MPRGDRGARKDYFRPRSSPAEALAKRKKLFAAINQLAQKKGDAWLISVPGAPMVEMHCLETSTLPDQLRQAGYDLTDAGVGERLLANAIETRLTLTSSGGYELMTEGSTKPVASIVRHAGIVPVKRFTFSIP